MGAKTAQMSVWALVRRQHGVITRRQLLALGYSRKAIRHRVEAGRLHPIFAGVYAVGRREVSQEGFWMAAVLSCGEGALLSHESAAQLWGIRDRRRLPVDISIPRPRTARRRGIRVHRRELRDEMRDMQSGIPVTSPMQTLVDLALILGEAELDRAINEADNLGRIRADTIDPPRGARGAARLRRHLASPAFFVTDSELERRFVPIALRTGLPKPETQVVLNGHRVDFFFRAAGLVVETDGLRYHRTPTQQKRDRVRDQELTARGLCVLRFTHDQIAHEPEHVADVLRRLSSNT
jgi:very-short-patch-repair endonuclease